MRSCPARIQTNGHFHVVNIPIENVTVSCKVVKPEFEARRFHMSEISRENSAGAPDLPPAIFFPRYFFKCDLGLAPAEGSAIFFPRYVFKKESRNILESGIEPTRGRDSNSSSSLHWNVI